MNKKCLKISELFELMSDDNAEAFKELYARYKEAVFISVKRRVPDAEEARDVTQEVFIYLWDNRRKLKQLEHFESWLYAIIRNKVISAYRKHSIRVRNEQLLANLVEHLEWDSETMVIAKELEGKIADIISTMPETMQNCYRLSKKEGLDNHEIAKLLNVSEKTVRNNKYEVSKKLKTTLSSHYPEFLVLLSVLDNF
ncbi:sigma-70 family RNA polymerase sigma factor [Sphingobacterium sp. UT-1RO-CII-1]|uniref:RNA polymerase sigma factor n=1 Tax=Sphingobacterium sp. UT-1RO-CII-1 TaxID=2995225 RepID=UPI00227BD718|nr:sigma-70 family RNA polymerase sigma factor [Sphingobacterium sp. UT-1RO-CII-1]MCY4779146.1 sigma-70 family RNA polymerase sigma factor [Sphingobacterium sp. UT-1RO-CII-1]